MRRPHGGFGRGFIWGVAFAAMWNWRVIVLLAALVFLGIASDCHHYFGL